MPGISILTDLQPKDMMKIARRVGEDLRFRVEQDEHDALRLISGSQMAAIFLGVMVDPYCDFRIYVNKEPKDRTDISIKWTTNPWTSGGLIGMGRVKQKAQRLADDLEDDIRRMGGRILDSEEY